MPTKYEIESLDGIEDNDLKAYYKEHKADDGSVSYRFDIDEHVKGLKTALVKEREAAKEHARALEAYKGLGSLDELQEKLNSLKDVSAKKEETETVAQRLKAEFESKLSESEKRYNELVQKNTIGSLKEELLKLRFDPDELDYAEFLATKHLKFGKDGVKAVDENGELMIGSGAGGLATIKDLAAHIAEKNPKKVLADNVNNGSGTPPNGETPKPHNKQSLISSDPNERLAAVSNIIQDMK